MYRNKVFLKAVNFKQYCTTKLSTVKCIYENPKANAREQIEIKGWIKSVRKLKENIFFDISDGSSSKQLQIVVKELSNLKNLSVGSSVIINGTVDLTNKGQPEIKANSIKICGDCDLNDNYPFLPRKKYEPEYVRQFLHLRHRTRKFSSLLRLRSDAAYYFHHFFKNEGYIQVNTPILTSNDCEGAGEVFVVRPENETLIKNMAKEKQHSDEVYFNCKAFLSVSGQLHLESLANGLNKVYTLGPIFRAENSRSRLHLSEFYMLEAEIAFINKLEQLTNEVEKLLKDVTQNILNNAEEDLKSCQENDVDFSWIDKNFPIIKYDECMEILKNKTDNFNEKSGITKQHELLLCEHCGNVPVFVVDWPKNGKPFYMKECEYDSSKVSALDLLAPKVGEIVGGSLREDDYNKLKNNLPNTGSNLDWYLEIRKFGGVQTGGYGLGFERYLQFITGISNIKDTIPFPRWPHNCSL